jgi:peroxiredoxin
LAINASAPDFTAKDQHGKEINLTSLKQKGPVVVVFYRGNWCPYCNNELKKLQDSLEFITAKGATVVAISPEAAEGVDATIAKTGAAFSVLHDENVKIAKTYDVSYDVDEKTRTMYLEKWNVDFLRTNNQKGKAILPVPAVYIIDKKGKISYRYFDKDITKRPSVKELIDNLK